MKPALGTWLNSIHQHSPQIFLDGHCCWYQMCLQQKQCPLHQFLSSGVAGCLRSHQTGGVLPCWVVWRELQLSVQYLGCLGRLECTPSVDSIGTPNLYFEYVFQPGNILHYTNINKNTFWYVFLTCTRYIDMVWLAIDESNVGTLSYQ